MAVLATSPNFYSGFGESGDHACLKHKRKRFDPSRPHDMTDNRIDVTELVEELSEERQLVAYERACKAVGLPTSRGDDGVLQVHTDDENYMDDPELVEAFSLELRKMVFYDIMDSLKEKGLAQAEVEPDTGELIFSLTEKGSKEAEKIIAEKEE